MAYLGRVAGRSMPLLLLLLLSSSPSSRCVLAMSTGLSGCLSGFIRGGPPQQRAGLGAQACLAMPCSSQLSCQLCDCVQLRFSKGQSTRRSVFAPVFESAQKSRDCHKAERRVCIVALQLRGKKKRRRAAAMMVEQ